MANYQYMRELYKEQSVAQANDELLSYISDGREYRNLDLGKLFTECFGWHEFDFCRRHPRPGEYSVHDVITRGGAITEAEGAVSTVAFQNIVGQYLYSAVLDAYKDEDTVFMDLIPEVKTQFLEGEKLPGISQLGDEAAVRDEGEPYALAGVAEDWIFTPPVKDRGMQVNVTWESIFADRTGVLLQRCSDVGKWIKINREKRAVDCVIDENTTAHRYSWRGLGAMASFSDNSGSHSFDNLVASNPILDWSSLNAAEQVFNAITDPYTGEELEWEPTHLIVTKQNEQIARRIIRAGEIRVTTPGYATSANPTQTLVANPYSSKYTLVTSRRLASRLATDTDWFLGNIGAYAKYMVAEPMMVLQAPSGNTDEFERRIVAKFRANERGAYVVVQPRAMVKSTA